MLIQVLAGSSNCWWKRLTKSAEDQNRRLLLHTCCLLFLLLNLSTFTSFDTAELLLPHVTFPFTAQLFLGCKELHRGPSVSQRRERLAHLLHQKVLLSLIRRWKPTQNRVSCSYSCINLFAANIGFKKFSLERDFSKNCTERTHCEWQKHLFPFWHTGIRCHRISYLLSQCACTQLLRPVLGQKWPQDVCVLSVIDHNTRYW